MVLSHLTRGAWIEISNKCYNHHFAIKSHLTRGAWIEILSKFIIDSNNLCRTSHEVRGLKFHYHG